MLRATAVTLTKRSEERKSFCAVACATSMACGIVGSQAEADGERAQAEQSRRTQAIWARTAVSAKPLSPVSRVASSSFASAA